MTINKNAIPNDPEKPWSPAGVRVGTPAMTTRGFKDEEARLTANLIADVLDKASRRSQHRRRARQGQCADGPLPRVPLKMMAPTLCTSCHCAAPRGG